MNSDADKKAKERVEKINQADSLIFQTEKQLKEFGDKLTEANKGAINAALEKLKEAHKSQDLTSIENAMNALNTAWQAASQEMYANSGAGTGEGSGPQAGANPGGAGASEGGANQDNVSDVEYEEVKK